MIKKNLLACVLIILFVLPVFSQPAEKIWFDKTDSVYGYYLVIPPSSGRIQAALILLDGYGGNADRFLSETKIQNVAYANDILTVCVPTGMRLYADKSMIELLNRVASDMLSSYHLRKEQFAIGGMSSGGTIALRYAELCMEKPAEFPIRPQAVFDVDSPVDLIGLYQSSEDALQTNNPAWWWLGEARMITDRFKKELGDPKTDIGKYAEVSPFYKDSREPGNERFLKDLAFRTYHDVDVSWHIQNRHHSLYGTNMLNASELVNRLVIMGNNQAEFVSSKIEGRRANGQRHPHSWNIVDEIDLVQWIREKLNFYPDHLKAPYVYNAPANGAHEIIPFPMDFAPALPYKGFEELHFTPGWGDANSGQKWAYTFLWWLDGSYSFNEKILQHDLEAYFTGINRRRAVAEKQDLSAFTPAKVQVQKIKPAKGDLETYTATAAIYDAQVTKKPGTLYYKIHVKDCPDKTKTLVLFEIAGNPFSASAWQDLDKINEDFRCAK